jgi:hypothetical protein
LVQSNIKPFVALAPISNGNVSLIAIQLPQAEDIFATATVALVGFVKFA